MEGVQNRKSLTWWWEIKGSQVALPFSCSVRDNVPHVQKSVVKRSEKMGFWYYHLTPYVASNKHTN